MSAEKLLALLDKPRRTGAGTWIARCPSHQDRNPSMTIRECDDGRVLLHCFAGCSVHDVLGAVGLDFDALFPPKAIADRVEPLRRPFPAADVLEAIMFDALTLQQVANEVQRSATVTPHQRALLQGAIARVSAARDLVNGQR
jgi:hypothetical protein